VGSIPILGYVKVSGTEPSC